jgi:enoyl-CoA hydratase/carnithine racemase
VVETRDGIMHVRLNRPEKKNALTWEMYSALAEALKEADREPKVRVVRVTGTGDAFTSGNDVSAFVAAKSEPGDRPPDDFLNAIAVLEKPLIAAVNGFAVGVGATMLLHCDLVYAAKSAVFSFPLVDLGVFPEAASTVLLPLLCGHQKAMELFMFSDRFDAETAREIGMVNAVLDDEELEAETIARAERLAAKPAAALRATKAMVRSGRPPLDQRIRDEMEPFFERVRSPEAQEAFNAFMEKRKPDFSQFD